MNTTIKNFHNYRSPRDERTLDAIVSALARLDQRTTQQGVTIMSELTALRDEVVALKAQSDTMQTNQAKVEKMLADLIASGGLSAEDKAAVAEARALLQAETADLAADNADSPANPPAPPAEPTA